MIRKLAVALVLALVWTAFAEEPGSIFLRITRSMFEKAPIAVAIEHEETVYWKEFLATLKRDLEYSGFFSVPSASLGRDARSRVSGASANLLLVGSPSGSAAVFSVEDLARKEPLFRHELAVENDPAVFAHRVSDLITFSITGVPGIACSRIAFVTNRTGLFQIHIIDYDGRNEKTVTDESEMVHYPRWIPDGNLLLVSYRGGWPKLVHFDPVRRAMRTLLAEPGLNACASYCPATDEVAVVTTRSGNPEIYITDRNGKILSQLTHYRRVDSSPSFSPDGKSLAFVSDREGTPQIYTMNRDGFQVRRISFISSYCTGPVWSPDGKTIAYVYSRGGGFGIALYDLRTGKTSSVDGIPGCEEISWAPNSRHLVFSRPRPASLWIVDTYTGETRRLTGDVSSSFSPAWSWK